jgi:DNA-binding NarL/FixJ family response regulator
MLRKRVLIADDHELYRRGVRDLLLARSFDVVGEAAEGGEALDQAVAYKPDVVVMDVAMPGMNGIEATRKIKEQVPETNVVVISASDDDDQIFEAIQAGVSGYILKDDNATALVQAVESAAEGKAYLPSIIAKRVLDGVAGMSSKQDSLSKGSTPLTGRELTVLRLMALGKRNREIGETLCISERTVGNHITNIYNKLCIYDRAQAIVYAIKKGVIRI